MKSGAGSDPFSDESEDEAKTNDAGQSPDEKSDSSLDTTADTNRSAGRSEASDPFQTDTLPYIYSRDGVKCERSMVQYFLRSETEELETDVRSMVEAELDTDVYLTDLREALVRVGAAHVDDVVDELRGWGYRFKD
jgi:hypothetical protein